MPRVHPDVTDERVIELVEAEAFGLENPGLCLSCGEERSGCEPDARRYECYNCGEWEVYGAAEILVMGAYHRA